MHATLPADEAQTHDSRKLSDANWHTHRRTQAGQARTQASTHISHANTNHATPHSTFPVSEQAAANKADPTFKCPRALTEAVRQKTEVSDDPMMVMLSEPVHEGRRGVDD